MKRNKYLFFIIIVFSFFSCINPFSKGKLETTNKKDINLSKNDSSNNENNVDYFLMGLNCFNEGDLIKAEKYFKKDLKYKKNAESYFYLGLIAEKNKKFDEATNYWEEGLVINPQHIPMRYNVGKILYECKKYYEALDNFKYLENSSSKPDDLYNWIAKTYYQLGKYKDASKYYAQLYEEKKSDKQIIIEYTLSLSNIGYNWRAINIINNSFIFFPNDCELYDLLGDFYTNENKIEDAEKSYLAAISYSNLKSDIKKNASIKLALLYYNSKNYEKAINIYKKIAQDFENEVKTYYYLAMCYERLNQLPQALNYWKIFVKKGEKIYSLNELVEFGKERINILQKNY